MTINEYFDKVLVINVAHRTDRWEQCLEQFRRFDIKFERFDAHYKKGDGNTQCTASHRGVLELICHNRWPRTLILEDDFQILHDDFHDRFSSMIGEVPTDWQMLYLGAGYGEAPQSRVSPHVIRAGHLKTTSSYAVTYDFARMVAPHIAGIGPIDELYCQYNRNLPTYIFQPRLMIQRESFSDLQGHVINNGVSMLDSWHEQQV